MSDTEPEDFDDPETLAGRLRSIGPDSHVEITWEAPGGLVSAEGTVTDFERGQAYKRIDTDDRTLQITTDEYNTRVTVSEVTADGTTELGPLRAIPVIERAVEQLRLTDEGVEVPSYYVGYDGLMTIRDSDGPATANMIGGLDEYDDRLLTGFTSLPPHYDEEEVLIGPLSGPMRVFEIVDERTPPNRREDERRLEETPYQAFVPAIAVVTELESIVFFDDAVPFEPSASVCTITTEMHNALATARRTVLPLEVTRLFSRRVEAVDARDWETYGEILSRLERQITELETLASDDDSLASAERTKARTALREALHGLEELRELLPEDTRPTTLQDAEEGPEDDETASTAETVEHPVDEVTTDGR